MKKIRLGNDIPIEWAINRNDQPEDFTGKTLRLTMIGTSGTAEVTDYTVEGNVLRWMFWGKDQHKPSTYHFCLVENGGEEGMFTIDTCNVLGLVSRSCAADDCDGEAHSDVVTRVYGTQYVAPATRIMVGDQIVSANLQYAYYREATAFDPADTVVVIDGSGYVRIDMNASVETGKYYVYAEVLSTNVNYVGYIFDTYFVVKATLAYSGGVLPSKSVSYGESISSVDFGNVSLTAGSEIYYGSFELVVPDGEGGYLTEAYLPVSTDTENNTVIRFIPSGSDEVIAKYNKNYHPYSSGYFLRVNKKDISDAIEVSDLVHVYDGLIENKTISASVADPENEGGYLPLHAQQLVVGVPGLTVRPVPLPLQLQLFF